MGRRTGTRRGRHETMSREAFMAAIRAAPEDDGPRLVFADWLDEQGENDRAEFIRIQLKLHGDPYSPLRDTDLGTRQRVLAGSHFSEWFGGLRQLGARVGEEGLWRGFPRRVFLSNFERARAKIPRMFELAPIRSLAFCGLAD